MSFLFGGALSEETRLKGFQRKLKSQAHVLEKEIRQLNLNGNSLTKELRKIDCITAATAKAFK